MWGMGSPKAGQKAVKKERVFDPHETACAEALAGTPLASFWQRAAAFVIDFIIVLAVYVPFEMALQYLVMSYTHHPVHIAVNFRLHDLEDLIWLVGYAGFLVWWTNGFTVGKRLLGIRVVSVVKTKITLWQAVERALGYGASALEGGFGFLQFFLHRNRCCVHDRIAETIVIKEPRREKKPARRSTQPATQNPMQPAAQVATPPSARPSNEPASKH